MQFGPCLPESAQVRGTFEVGELRILIALHALQPYQFSTINVTKSVEQTLERAAPILADLIGRRLGKGGEHGVVRPLHELKLQLAKWSDIGLHHISVNRQGS